MSYGMTSYRPPAGQQTPAIGAPGSGPRQTSRPVGASRQPVSPSVTVPPPPTTTVPSATYGPAQASAPDLNGLYRQLIASVGQGQLPASTVGSSNAIAAMYAGQGQQLAALNAQLLAQQRALADATRGLAGQARLPIANFGALEQQLLAEANRRQPSEATFMYGFA